MKRAAALAVVVTLLLAAWLLPVSDWLLKVVAWMQSAGGAGVGVYSLVYLVATVFVLPGSVLTLGAGFVYGPTLGTLLVSPVSVISATAAFLLGRSLAREWVARRLAGHPRLSALERAVSRNGIRTVVLLRLSPILPFNLLNYALALTRVRLRDYILGSFLGMLPWTFVYVYLGSLVTTASELAHGGPAGYGRAASVAGLVLTAIVVVILGRFARRALEQDLRQVEA
ncbi:MAG: TVP38/TMEM64 family protein [Myxococcales bacterium]|nr:TVP38/TMEM64 family protein [Myxococcales bacterium]